MSQETDRLLNEIKALFLPPSGAAKVHYEVRIKCYRYNSGKADNGYFTERLACDTLEEAKKIHQLAVTDKDGGWMDLIEKYISYPCGGTIKEILGIFEITTLERKIA